MAIAAFVVWNVVWNIQERRRQRQITASRESWTRQRFVDVLQADGVSSDTAEFVWEQIEPYYFAPLMPHPDDDLLNLMKIDPDDISDDVIDYARKFSFDLPKGRIDWPVPLTATAYALWLDELRSAAR